MKSLEEFTYGVQRLMEYLEILIRGGGTSTSYSKFPPSSGITNDQDGKQLAYQLLNWISLDSTKDELFKYVPVNDVSEFVALSIKLNNKSRNIPQSVGGCVRALSKAISGFMLLRFHDATMKSFKIVITLLSSATNDIDNNELELRCCGGVVETWDKLSNEDSLLRDISASDLEFLRITLFKTFISQAELYINLRIPNSIEESNRSLSRALEFQHNIPLGLILYFARKSVEIGKKMSTTPIVLESSKFYFNIALNILDSNTIKGKLKHSDVNYKVEIEELRRSTCLLLAFVHMELGECDQALACIQKIENNSNFEMTDDFMATLSYAKFNIHLKDNNITSAESYLKTLLKLPIEYDMAIDAVKTFVDTVSQRAIRGSLNSIQDLYYFKLLVNKFPNDPEFSSTRISQIQSLVAVMENIDSNQNEGFHSSFDPLTKQLMDIIEVVISDHNSNLRSLCNEHFIALKGILIERIQWYRSRNEWKACIKWCDLLLCLLNEKDHQNDFMMFSLHKVDALLNCSRFEESYKLALNVLSKQPPTTTCLLICFKAFIHQISALESLAYIQKYMKQNMTIMNITNGSTDGLYLIFSCYNITCESNLNEESKSNIKILVIKEWLSYYISSRAWRNEDFNKSEDISFLKMACIYIQEIVLINLSILDSESATLELSAMSTQIDIDNTDVELQSNRNVNSSAVDSLSKVGTIKSAQKLPFGEFNSNNRYIFKESLEYLQLEVLDVLELISVNFNTIKADGFDIRVLGSSEDLEWLGNVMWHIGILLVRTLICTFQIVNNIDVSIDGVKSTRNILGAKFFELAERIYGSMTIGDRNIITKNQVLCLIISAAGRLDGENYFIEKSRKSEFEIVDIGPKVTSPSLTNNLQLCKNNLVKSNQLLRRLVGFEDANTLKDLKHICLILEFSCLCKCYPPIDSSIIELFVNEKNEEFLDLYLHEIEKCAAIAEQEPSGNIHLVRSMYNYALQICTKELSADDPKMGTIYCKLIELSSSRQQSLQCIEEFSQLLFSKCSNKSNVLDNHSDSPTGFNIDDIDYVCSLSYNNGVTLLELDQIQLAEKFIMKAKELLPFTTTALSNEWKDRLQETYTHILKAQNNSSKMELLSKSVTENMLTIDSHAITMINDKEGYLTVDNLK